MINFNSSYGLVFFNKAQENQGIIYLSNLDQAKALYNDIQNGKKLENIFDTIKDSSFQLVEYYKNSKEIENIINKKQNAVIRPYSLDRKPVITNLTLVNLNKPITF